MRSVFHHSQGIGDVFRNGFVKWRRAGRERTSQRTPQVRRRCLSERAMNRPALAMLAGNCTVKIQMYFLELPYSFTVSLKSVV